MANVKHAQQISDLIGLRLRAKMIWPLAPPLSTSILKDTALIVQLTLEATETKHPV